VKKIAEFESLRRVNEFMMYLLEVNLNIFSLIALKM